MITKQLFLTARTCSTRAWYDRHGLSQSPDRSALWLFHNGNAIQEAARAQLGDGHLLPRTPDAVALQATKEALGNSLRDLLFEASFRWNRHSARADALRRNGDGWDLIEIKATKSPDDGAPPAANLLDDLGYTTMVVREAGLPVHRSVLFLINRDYRLGNDEPLMVEVDVTAAAKARANEFAQVATRTAAAVLGDERPTPIPLLACRNCDYFGRECLGQGIEHPVFQIPRLSAKTFATFEPELDLLRIPSATPLTSQQRQVFEAIRSGTPIVNRDGLARLDRVEWPAYYLDFETVNPALPWFEGDGAYETLPFQYSLHVVVAPGVAPVHQEYLAPVDGDWRVELLERMLDALGREGSIIVYTKFEEQRLREMARRNPVYADRINAVIGRLFDLEEVVRFGYTHPGFGGRTSIKKVLPVMVPELQYKGMEIADGNQASAVFGLARLGALPAPDWPRHRDALLEYCKLDTLAMVRVHQELIKVKANSATPG